MGDPVAWREEWCRHGDAEAKGLSHGVMQVCFEGDENTLILLLYAKPHIGTVGTVWCKASFELWLTPQDISALPILLDHNMALLL